MTDTSRQVRDSYRLGMLLGQQDVKRGLWCKPLACLKEISSSTAPESPRSFISGYVRAYKDYLDGVETNAIVTVRKT